MGNLAHGFFDGAADDVHTSHFIVVSGLDVGEDLAHADEGSAAARDDAFFNSSAGGVQGVFHAVLLFLHLNFSSGTDTDDGHATDQLGQTFLELLTVVIGSGVVDLIADLLHAFLDLFLAAEAVNDGGVFLLDLDALGLAEFVEGQVLDLGAGVIGSDDTAGKGGDILEHGLAAVTKAGSLDGDNLKGATDLVHDQGGKGFAFHVLSDDEEGLVDLGDLLEDRKHILHVGDLLVSAEDVGVLHLAHHLFSIGAEVRREIAAVETHAFHDIHGGLEALGFFDRDDAFLAYLGHGLGNDGADGGVRVGGNGADLGNFLLIAGGLGNILELSDQGFNGLVHATLDGDGITAGGHELHAFAVHGLSENGGGGGTVASGIGSLGSDFLNELGAHVLVLVFELDFLGNGHTVLGDDRSAEALLDGHVAALGSKGDLNGIGEFINAQGKTLTGLYVKNNIFSHGNFPPG